MAILFKSVVVNAIDGNSTVSIGDNTQSDWNSTSKDNIGFGTRIGLSYSNGQSNHVIDNDFVDTIIGAVPVPSIIKKQS